MEKTDEPKVPLCTECNTNIHEHPLDYFYSVSTNYDRAGRHIGENRVHDGVCSYACLEKNMQKYFRDAEDTYNYSITKIRK